MSIFVWILSSATFLLKAQRGPFVDFSFKPGDCATHLVYAAMSQESVTRGNAGPVRTQAPGWAERHVASGAPLTSVCRACIYRQRTHTQMPPHMQTAVFASTRAL